MSAYKVEANGKVGEGPEGWRGTGYSLLPLCTEAEMEALAQVGQGSRKLEGWWLKMRQFHGLLVKRFHCARRNSKALCSQILLPAFFVCVAMTVALSVPEIGKTAWLTWCGQGSCVAPGSWLHFPPSPLENSPPPLSSHSEPYSGTHERICLPGSHTPQTWPSLGWVWGLASGNCSLLRSLCSPTR